MIIYQKLAELLYHFLGYFIKWFSQSMVTKQVCEPASKWIILITSLQNWVITLSDQLLIEWRLWSLLRIQEMIGICLNHDKTCKSSCPWLGIRLHTTLLWENSELFDTFKYGTWLKMLELDKWQPCWYKWISSQFDDRSQCFITREYENTGFISVMDTYRVVSISGNTRMGGLDHGFFIDFFTT